MPIGAHTSIAGGVDQALERGASLGCETIQLFTRNRNRWEAKPLARPEIQRFRTQQARTGIQPLLAHASYLINLASSQQEIFDKSVAAFREEMKRAGSLGIPYLVIHPGSHGGSGEDGSLKRVADALDRTLAEADASWPLILLETTAGQGNSLGYRFEHLVRIRDRSRHPEGLGFCFDTCHVFASGYDIRSPGGYERTLGRFISLAGIEGLAAFHLNDSRRALGSRVDRHEHIGRGELGKLPFYLLLHDERFSGLPMVLETPKGTEGGRDLDAINLATLWNLRGAKTFPDEPSGP